MQALIDTPVSTTPHRRWAGALIPSMCDVFFGALLVWVLLAGGGKMLLGDGDTGWHIRTGDYILQHHQVPRQDMFSFTMPNEPWFAWEWLSDVAFASIHNIWGLKGVALFAGLIFCSAAAVLFAHMLSMGGNLFLSLTLALLANGATLVHFLARPHMFTFLLLAITLWLLDRDRRKQGRAVWLLVPITALWVNLHGAFLALIACLGLTVAGYALQLVFRGNEDDPKRAWSCLRRYSMLTVVCSMATFLNPYGYRLHIHLAK